MTKSLLQQHTYTLDWVKEFYTQAAIWWGEDPQEPGVHAARVQCIERLHGPGPWRILDLGAGPGRTAAALADAGHQVTAVELNPTDARYARQLLNTPRRGSLAYLEADFYTVALQGRFDVVACWQVFGIGADPDQRRLLGRIRQEWLAEDGCVLLDVYHPAGPARDHGKAWRLDPLPGVPGSVEMIERCHYDPLEGRWIDEWQPVAHPEHTLAQSLRCYTPADLRLLLEGSGLRLAYVEIEDQAVDISAGQVLTGSQFFHRDYNYLVKLEQDDEQTAQTSA